MTSTISSCARASAFAALLSLPGVAQGKVDLASQGDSTDPPRRMRAAMLSVHALVDRERPELRDVLRDVVPMPADRIATLLLADDTPVGRSRQRRAGMRLLALAANPRAKGDDRTAARKAAERLLSREEVAYVLRVLENVFGGHCQPDETDVEPLVTTLLGPICIDGCCWSGSEPRIYRGEKTFDINMDFDFTGTTLERAAKGLDPQEWDACSPLWKDTWLCKQKEDGTPEEVNGVCVESAVTPSGSDFGGKRLLYEHFQCDGTPCSVQLYLDAKVTVPDGPSGYDFWYSHPRMIAGPTIVPDQGGVQMSAGASSVSVHSRKTFGFAEFRDAAIVSLMLSKIETSHYLGELVCCH